MGNKVIGFRSVVITLDHGMPRSRILHCVRLVLMGAAKIV